MEKDKSVSWLRSATNSNNTLSNPAILIRLKSLTASLEPNYVRGAEDYRPLYNVIVNFATNKYTLSAVIGALKNLPVKVHTALEQALLNILWLIDLENEEYRQSLGNIIRECIKEDVGILTIQICKESLEADLLEAGGCVPNSALWKKKEVRINTAIT